MKIHPTAVVGLSAEIGRDVTIGPFCVVEDGARIGDGSVLESHVVVKRGVDLGPSNHLFEGAVLGGIPQHQKVPAETGGVRIGAGNTIREHVTIHRSLDPDAATTVGDYNLLMVNVHIAHDCHVGNRAIITNNSLLAGHVTVDDRAYISGSVAVHQFCRIGSLAMVGGLARVKKDIPPYVTVDGMSGLVVGLNTIGLRRNGYSSEAILQIKQIYRLVYRTGLPWTEIVRRAQAEFTTGPAGEFSAFLTRGTRGIVPERRMPPGATIKLRDDPGGDQLPAKLAG